MRAIVLGALGALLVVVPLRVSTQTLTAGTDVARYAGELAHRPARSCGEFPSVHIELELIGDRVEGWREIKIGRDGGRGRALVSAEIVDGKFQQIVEMKNASKGNKTRVHGSVNGDVIDVAVEAGQGDCSSYAGTLQREF